MNELNRSELRDDLAAFEQHFRAEIEKYIKRELLPGVPSDAADDIYQDYCVRLFQSWDAIRTKQVVRKYIRKLAYSAIIDYVRHSGIKVKALPMLATRQPTTGNPTVDQVQRKEVGDRLWKRIGTLTETEKHILQGWGEGKSNVTLGGELGLHRKTVANHGKSAVDHISKYMKELLEEQEP